MKKLTLFVATLALALPLTVNAASPQKPGKWQMTTEMDVPGMPIKMPAVTTYVCVTKEDVENPEKSLPKASNDKNANCKYSDVKVDKNTVSWSVKCEGKNPLTGSGQVTYTSDTFDGSMKMKMSEAEITAKYKGKFLGECDGTEANAKKK